MSKDTQISDAMTDEIDLIQLAGTIWRGKWIVFLCAVLAVLAGGYYAFKIAVPLYPATTTVVLDTRQQQVITDFESILAGGNGSDASVNTELQVLRSRELIGQVVDRLDLVMHSEFNASLREPSDLDRLRGRLRGVVAGLLGGQDEEDVNSTPPRNATVVRRGVVSAVLGAVSVSSIRGTLVMTITVTTTDPQLSVLIANELAEVYIENQIQVKLDALADATEFLSERTSELRLSLEDLEQQFADATDEASGVSAEEIVAQTLQLRELRFRLSEAREDLEADEQRLEQLRALLAAGELGALVAGADDFRLNRALTQHRNGVLSDEELSVEIDRFFSQLDAAYARDAEQVVALERTEENLVAQIDQQTADLAILQQLQREVESARLLYESFFTRLQEITVQQGLETADARILSEAIPRGASSPRKNRILALSGILGVMLGVGLVLLREMRFSGFRSADDLNALTDIRVLASVPLIPQKNRKAVIKYLKDKQNSVVSEAIRNLRTSILMSNIDHPPKVIMLTSSVPGEGKTTLALGLAQNMVGMGKRVLLIEADIRRRVFSSYLTVENSVALLDLLTGKVKAEDATPFVKELGCDVLMGTKSDINAADLFASERFASLIKELKDHYDYILIDTPPVLAVPDARVIGAHADAIVYAVHWNKTSRTQVRHGTDMLNSVGVPITGFALNQIDSRKMRTYGYAGQYGYDTYGSRYYDT